VISPELLDSAEGLMLQAARAQGYQQGGAVGIRLLADQLGIAIRTESGQSGSHAEGLLVADGARATIHLRQDDSEVHSNSRATFTVAHEVAHALFNMAVGRTPTSQAEYWRLESVCNRVAGKLLVPDDSWPPASELTSAKLVLTTSLRLATRLSISRDVVLRRAMDSFSFISAAGALEVRKHQSKGVIGRTSWVAPDGWNGLRSGTHITIENPLWRPLIGGDSGGPWLATASLGTAQIARIRGARRVHFVALESPTPG